MPGGLQIVCKKLGQALQSLRVRQRKETNIQSKQIIIENKYRGGRGLPIQNFCELCKLKYHTDERKHEKSRSHLTIKAFLNKKCKLCDVRSNSIIFLLVSYVFYVCLNLWSRSVSLKALHWAKRLRLTRKRRM